MPIPSPQSLDISKLLTGLTNVRRLRLETTCLSGYDFGFDTITEALDSAALYLAAAEGCFQGLLDVAAEEKR